MPLSTTICTHRSLLKLKNIKTMPFTKTNRNNTLSGILFVALFALASVQIAQIPAIISLGISPLIIGILIGMIYANTLRESLPQNWEPGIVFSARRILRFAIVLYGFRITFQEIAAVGTEGLIVSAFMLLTTLGLGTWVGMKVFKLDRDTSILTAAGSAICGAAAVLAFEVVLKSKAHKGAAAVATVVLFGTLSMFLYPVLYRMGLFDLDMSAFGIFIGGSVHEVAQVVAAGAAVSPETADTAVIVKMTRVMMMAPLLLIMGYILSRQDSKEGGSKATIVIPWFALMFIAVAGFNSLHLLPTTLVDKINVIDTFLLTMAMTALGMETRLSKFKGIGLKPLYTAAVLFVWLLLAGYGITWLTTN